MSEEVNKMREVWHRLFGINVEAARIRRGLSSLAEHLEMLKNYQASSAHVDELLKRISSKDRRPIEFNDDQTGFWDAELNQRIKKMFDSEKATPPVSAKAQQQQERSNRP